MEDEGKAILKRLDAAKTERSRYEPLFDDCIRLTMPARKRFFDPNTADRAEDIFDETGANAVEEFTSRMQAGIMPPFQQFLKLRASSLVEARDREAVNRDLDEITAYAFEEIWRSNFAQESVESLNDMAISTGTLIVDPGQGVERLHHRAVPITDVYFERGFDGRIGAQFRVREDIAVKDIESLYPLATIPEGSDLARKIKQESDAKVTIVELVERRLAKGNEQTRHRVMVKDPVTIILDKEHVGAGSSPYISYRWASAAGETWGRGPLLRAMGAIRTTNLMVELVLENAAMAIVGLYQTDNDGILNSDTVQLLPGTILPRQAGTRGLEPVNAATGNFNMRDVVLSDQRMNIKRALYNDMLADPNRTPASATEVVERMADLAYRTSSGFLRIHHEFLVPYIMRVLYLLERKGDIEMPTKRGRALSFVPVSPLASAQLARQIQSLFQDFQIRSAMFGPEQANMHYDFETLHGWLIENFGLPERLYRSADEILEKIAEAAEAMQASMMGQQQAASVAPAAGATGNVQPGV